MIKKVSADGAFDSAIDEAEQTLWQFLNGFREAPIEPCHWLLGMGCADIRVAQCSARLYLAGYVQNIVFSGGFGRLTKQIFNTSEAEVFFDVARNLGVPHSAIILETRAANTAENLRHSLNLMAGVSAEQSIVLVCSNLYRPRVYATLQKLYPGQASILVSPKLSLDEYAPSRKDRLHALHLMVGEIDRLLSYPRLGWISTLELPNSVQAAYRYLSKAGFNQHLLTN